MMKGMRVVLITAIAVIASCAVITVNIYFPEKDVKEAYKTLEKELMTPEEKPEPKPEGMPQSRIRFELFSTALAQEPGMADKIAQIIKNMPAVVAAYRDMGARAAETERLRDRGLVGEGNNGLLVIRDRSISPAEQKIVNDENENRRTVMKGMARAIIRINRVPETDANLNQVMPQAVEQFSSLRRDTAKKGWWIQDPGGNWFRK
jgi:uncharacterized protein YdbL (DUF1318 family)